MDSPFDPRVLGLLVAGFVLGVMVATAATVSVRQRFASAFARLATLASRKTPDDLALLQLASELPISVLLLATDGRIQYSNGRARQLLFNGQSTENLNFLHLLREAPPAVSKALSSPGDAIFSLTDDGITQTFQLLQRNIQLPGGQHRLLLINPLTREIARREVDLLKKVIRVINHELNNSLASLSSLVNTGRFVAEQQVADEGVTPKRLTQIFDGIASRTTHLQKFLSEYAQLSRLPVPRARKTPWAPVLAQLREAFPQVELGAPPESHGFFDATQVTQALINLLKNAVEAGGPESGVELIFRPQADHVEVGVLDRGLGFSPEALTQGLLPFYTTKEAGSGIGLALCREVAEGHGGGLRIKSREGGGAAVYLILPNENVSASRDMAATLTLTRT